MESNENHYNLRNESDFRQSLIRTVYHGRDNISYLDRAISGIASKTIKDTSAIGKVLLTYLLTLF